MLEFPEGDEDENNAYPSLSGSHTLMAKVRAATITSRSPLRTRLSGKVGLNSYIAFVIWTAVILVIWLMTVTDICKVNNMCKASNNKTKVNS